MLLRIFKNSIFLLYIFSTGSFAQEGFILRAGEGEKLLNGIVVKASPRTGTQHSIMVEQTFPTGDTTGLHLHEQGDELFYVVSGNGFATLEDKEEPISAGDVIFVPTKALHRIRNIDSEVLLVVVFYMDSPELVEQFRQMHERIVADPDNPITDEEIMEIEKRTGGGKSIINKN